MEQFRILYFLFNIIIAVLKRAWKYYSAPTLVSAQTSAPTEKVKNHKKTDQAFSKPVFTSQSTEKKPVKEVPAAKKLVHHKAQSQPTGSRISRYKGWKKAVVMHEVIQPYSR